MGLFDKQFEEITSFLSRKRCQGKFSESIHRDITDWPVSKNRNLVLGQDTAVELGNPKDASTSFLLWVNEPEKIVHNRITVVGPDLPQLNNQKVSFGKIVIIGGTGFDADNSYDRYREMELLRYDIHLKGYMMRAVSQHLREWSRVSKDAVQNGFSFQILGGALIDKFMEIDYVHAVETVFITSNKQDVLELKSISEGVATLISAMNKMMVEMTFDCDSCEYNEVCDDVSELRSMHKAIKKKELSANAAP